MKPITIENLVLAVGQQKADELNEMFPEGDAVRSAIFGAFINPGGGRDDYDDDAADQAIDPTFAEIADELAV